MTAQGMFEILWEILCWRMLLPGIGGGGERMPKELIWMLT